MGDLGGGGGGDLIEKDFHIGAIRTFPDDVVAVYEGHLIVGGVGGDLA